MLASKYEEIKSSNITIKKMVGAEYCCLSANEFIEPKGMHIFSIHKSSIYNSSTPIFKTNPTNTYLSGIAVDKNNIITDNESILKDAEGRISFISETIIPTTDQDINLSDLQAKMNKSFGVPYSAGIIAFRPKTTAKYYYGFKLNNSTVPIHGGEKLVVKLIAKVAAGYSLKAKYKCTEPLSYSSCNNDWISGNMFKGFVVNSNKYSSEITGTDRWEAYTFVIDNPYTTTGYLNSLTFYVGLTNSESTIDISIGDYTKYLYLCYMDFLVLPKNYSSLVYYNPLENVSSIKSGIFINAELVEENQLGATTSIDTKFKHDIVFKQNIAKDKESS